MTTNDHKCSTRNHHIRLRGGVYTYRRRVALDLVDVLGRTEITRTLQTSNHAIALERAAEVEAVLVKEFRALRSKEHTDAVELEAKLTALAEQYREELILTDRAGRRTFAPILDGDSDIAGR